MTRWATLGLLLCACTSSSSAVRSSTAAASVVAASAAEVHHEQQVSGGAVDSVTVVEEYALGGLTQSSERLISADGGVAPTGPSQLLRRTTTRTHVEPVAVRSTTDARSLTETHAQATEAATERGSSETRAGPPPWAWVWVPVALLLAGIAALWLWRRFG